MTPLAGAGARCFLVLTVQQSLPVLVACSQSAYLQNTDKSDTEGRPDFQPANLFSYFDFS